MELRDLRYFLDVVDEGSLPAAAKSLRMSPSTLSRRTRRLERELKATTHLIVRPNGADHQQGKDPPRQICAPPAAGNTSSRPPVSKPTTAPVTLICRNRRWALPDSKTMYSCLSSSRPAHLPAGTHTLSGAAISEFDTSVVTLTRWSPAFFPGVGWKTT